MTLPESVAVPNALFACATRRLAPTYVNASPASNLRCSEPRSSSNLRERKYFMNTRELQQLKMAWLAAEEAGDTHAKLSILRDHPERHESLIDFIAAYHTTPPANVQVIEADGLLPMTRRA